MRIAQVSDVYLPRLGGIEMHVHDLATEQRRAGHDVEVLTATAALGEGLDRVDPLAVRRLGGTALCAGTRGLSAARAVDQELVQGGYDAVHVHASVFSPVATAAARAASRAGLPTLITVHSLWAGHGPLPRWAAAAVGAPRWQVQWSAVSGIAADYVRRGLGESAEVAVLPNAIDIDYWRSALPRRTGTDIVIVSVMRLAGRKRPDRLLRVLRAVRAQLPSSVGIRAVIIGDGPLRPRLARVIQESGMAEWTELRGHLNRHQIREVLAGADLYIAPAELESFGLAALEARCAGVPIVAMGASGVADFVRHGREGLLAADERDLVDHVRTLCLDADLRTRIARHNRQTVPPYTWDSALAHTARLYLRADASPRFADAPEVPDRLGAAA